MIRRPGREPALATAAFFLLAGIAVAAWAALVPFARARLGIDDGTLGLLLLCPAIGSLLGMPVAGQLAARFGGRPVMAGFGAALCCSLPALAAANGLVSMAGALLWFGAALGGLDVAMNVEAVALEQRAGRPMMAGFHGGYSAGGIAGGLGMSVLLRCGPGPVAATAILAAILLALLAAGVARGAAPAVRPAGDGPDGPVPDGARGRFGWRVPALGLLCAICFLAEGTMVDWSGLLLDAAPGSAVAGRPEGAGLGYAAFSCTMTVGRLLGDRATRRAGRRPVMAAGGVLAACGLLVSALAPGRAIVLFGFVLVGLGLSNLVPLLIGAAGAGSARPARAVAWTSTLGYAGVLAGPALVGFVARRTGLPDAFCLVALLVALLPAGAVLLARR